MPHQLLACALRRYALSTRPLGPAAGATAVRYVSLGSGLMLADFEILCGFEAAGYPIESAIFIDTEYGRRPCQVRRAIHPNAFDSEHEAAPARVCTDA